MPAFVGGLGWTLRAYVANLGDAAILSLSHDEQTFAVALANLVAMSLTGFEGHRPPPAPPR